MFRDLVKANRSYRGYDGSYQIEREKLLSYVDLTRYAASSLNIQPLKYHIACEKEEVARILPLTKFAARLAHLHLPHEGMNPTAFIVICQDKNLAPNIASFQHFIHARRRRCVVLRVPLQPFRADHDSLSNSFHHPRFLRFAR